MHPQALFIKIDPELIAECIDDSRFDIRETEVQYTRLRVRQDLKRARLTRLITRMDGYHDFKWLNDNLFNVFEVFFLSFQEILVNNYSD